MTHRLYYLDSHQRAFDALVERCDVAGDEIRVVLDQTAFYPTSGGQPFDVGRLGPAEVRDVIDDEDGRIVHLVSELLKPGARVAGEIDWPRRFDHMQQHTGQHLLSAAFVRLFDVDTVGFHMGAEVSTIDLAREVTPSEIEAAESETNRVVWEDRRVSVRLVSADEAETLPFRKAPVRTGEIRVVEVEDFDLSACGGTHVARTGAVGLVAVTASERIRQNTRIGFACGRRALGSHQALRDIVLAVCRRLSTTPEACAGQVERLQQAAREADRAAAAHFGELAGYRAAAWRTAAESCGPWRLVLRHEPDLTADGLRTMARAVVDVPGLVAALVGQGAPTPVVVARSADVALDAGALVRRLTAAHSGRGGGRPDLAQAGIPVEGTELVTFLRQALTSPATVVDSE